MSEPSLTTAYNGFSPASFVCANSVSLHFATNKQRWRKPLMLDVRLSRFFLAIYFYDQQKNIFSSVFLTLWFRFGKMMRKKF